jgi:hypothetical protein
MFYDCRFLQLDALISTRVHDIPSLQYSQHNKKKISDIASLAASIATSGTVVKVSSSNPNKLPIVAQIDHYLLSTGLGLGFPFILKAVGSDKDA